MIQPDRAYYDERMFITFTLKKNKTYRFTFGSSEGWMRNGKVEMVAGTTGTIWTFKAQTTQLDLYGVIGEPYTGEMIEVCDT